MSPTFLSLLLLATATAVLSQRNRFDAMDILEKYGYLDDLPEGVDHSEATRGAAITEFQRFNGLRITGQLDRRTLRKMRQPRCGLPDVVKPSQRSQGLLDPNQPLAFHAPGYKWDKNELTYKFVGYTRKLGGSDQQRSISGAFRKWADVTPLRFRETTGTADIDINFARYNHGDGAGNSFDGRGGTLAHAFFPGGSALSGDTHFDDDEEWTVGQDRGTNLEIVAAHEFGHALGLGHSSVPTALMAPYYQGYDANFQLHADDKRGIQTLYAAEGACTPEGAKGGLGGAPPPLVPPDALVPPPLVPPDALVPPPRDPRAGTAICPSTPSKSPTTGRRTRSGRRRSTSWRPVRVWLGDSPSRSAASTPVPPTTWTPSSTTARGARPTSSKGPSCGGSRTTSWIRATPNASLPPSAVLEQPCSGGTGESTSSRVTVTSLGTKGSDPCHPGTPGLSRSSEAVFETAWAPPSDGRTAPPTSSRAEGTSSMTTTGGVCCQATPRTKPGLGWGVVPHLDPETSISSRHLLPQQRTTAPWPRHRSCQKIAPLPPLLSVFLTSLVLIRSTSPSPFSAMFSALSLPLCQH